MSIRGVSDQIHKAPITRIGTVVKDIIVRSTVIKIERVIMSKTGITTSITTSTKVAMVTEMIAVEPIFHIKIGKLNLGMVGAVWRDLRICCRK